MANKISEARRAKGWSQQELAERCGTTQQTIQRYEAGERELRASVLTTLSRVLGVTVAYLLGMNDGSDGRIRFVELPLYGSIAAGIPMDMVEVEEVHAVPEQVAAMYPGAFLLKVDGESMSRILPNGCYALVDPCDEVDRDGEPYAVCVNGYAATVKRVRRLQNGFELSPDSLDPTFKPIVYDYGVDGTDEVTVIGRVVWYTLPYRWSF